MMTEIPKRRFALEEKDLSIEADENNKIAEKKENRSVEKRKQEAIDLENRMQKAREKAVRDAMAAARGPWQGDVWSEGGEDESVGDEVEWSESIPELFEQE